MTAISLENIVKRYTSGVEAVRGVSFCIEPGEFLTIVGPSGCGKSTLLRMIAGLEDISEGTLKFDGQVMNNIGAKDRDVGMVFQNYALYPHLTVAENIAFPLTMRRDIPKNTVEARVKEVANMLELGSLMHRKPKELSGGQRQRVALGRAISRRPRVFLFDEPLSNLDAKLRSQMRLEITRLQKNVGSTGIYVTHDQTEAMTIGNRIAVLRDGKLQQIGTPREIYGSPANEFTAGFIGNPSMNFIRGFIEDSTEGLLFCEQNGIIIPLNALQYSFKKSLVAGAKATLGIRPEHLTYITVQGVPIWGEIIATEFLGHETLLYFRASPKSSVICCRTEQSYLPQIGKTVNFSIRPDALYFFDENGERM
ncbi:sn-glycerol-3-phosphate ABC transporter ATP-binding protein UgpC [Ignavibacteria bacterium]|nr:ABC transporter ATP-binding protein [Bacteroidota bacterium]MCZ2132005.1 ABC transporter ATP-binding protein [Bacteroidota bacterium]